MVNSYYFRDLSKIYVSVVWLLLGKVIPPGELSAIL